MLDVSHMPQLKLLLVVVNKEETREATRLIRKSRIPLHFQCIAQGTARSETLDLLGIGATDKALMVCVAPSPMVDRLFHDLSHDFRLMQPGKGVAFTSPLSGVSNLMYKFISQEVMEKMNMHTEHEVEKTKADTNYELVLAFINQGYSDDLMDAAREMGARGGTVVHARRVATEDTMKLWGISVQDEKEIVLLVVKKEQKAEIMKAIGKKCGLQTEAQGFAISLPVDGMAGFTAEYDEE